MNRNRKIYCGNNRNSIGDKKIGNRYECLKAGISLGKKLPIDETYLQPYDPIDNRKPYCGLQEELPNDTYDHLGSLKECHSVGVGVGKRQKASEQINISSEPVNNFSFWSINLIMILFFIILFLVFYFLKPSFILKDNTKNEIDWQKFGPDLSVLALLLIIIRIIILKFYA